MGWKGTLRSFNAAVKRAERHNRQMQKQQAALNAAMAFDRYESYLNDIVSYHKSVTTEVIDWEALKNAIEPIEPQRSSEHETIAINLLTNYRPNFLIKFFRLVNFRLNWLKKNVQRGKLRDEKIYQNNMNAYRPAHSRWRSDKELAEKMLSGDADAFAKLIDERHPFHSIKSFSGNMDFIFENGKTTINIEIDFDKNVPSETAKLLKSGTLSIKETTKTHYHQVCQDHVCSIALRVARETLALLPVEYIYVNVKHYTVDTSLGNLEMKSILSLKVPRATLKKINFENIDPSDCLRNFIHNMNFKRLEGFEAVEDVA
jgi:hypothetical protein